MKKSLTELIALKMSQKEPTQAAKNRAAFLAQVEEIKEALQAGWSKKLIWEVLKEQGRISFTYQAFLRYVTKIVEDSTLNKRPDVQMQSEGKEKNSNLAEPTPSKMVQLPEKSFKFNPNPDDEELF